MEAVIRISGLNELSADSALRLFKDKIRLKARAKVGNICFFAHPFPNNIWRPVVDVADAAIDMALNIFDGAWKRIVNTNPALKLSLAIIAAKASITIKEARKPFPESRIWNFGDFNVSQLFNLNDLWFLQFRYLFNDIRTDDLTIRSSHGEIVEKSTHLGLFNDRVRNKPIQKLNGNLSIGGDAPAVGSLAAFSFGLIDFAFKLCLKKIGQIFIGLFKTYDKMTGWYERYPTLGIKKTCVVLHVWNMPNHRLEVKDSQRLSGENRG